MQFTERGAQQSVFDGGQSLVGDIPVHRHTTLSWPAWLIDSALILWGIRWGLPHHPEVAQSWHADENASVYAIRQIHFPLFNPRWLPWGTALFYQMAAILRLVTVGGIFHLPPGGVLLLGRPVVWLYAMGVLAVTFLLGRDLFSPAVGRVGAVILAATPAFAVNSHYLKVEIPMMFWLLVTVWAAYRLIASHRHSQVMVLGLLAGYTTSVQYGGAIAVPAAAAALWMTRGLDRRRALKAFAVAVVVGFLIGTPYALLNPPGFYRALQFLWQITKQGSPYSVARPPAWVDYPLNVFPYAMTTPLLLVGAVGAVYAGVKKRRGSCPCGPSSQPSIFCSAVTTTAWSATRWPSCRSLRFS